MENFLPNSADMTCLSRVFVMRPVPFMDDLANVDLSKNTSIRFLRRRVAEPRSSLHAFRSLVLMNTSKPATRRTFSLPLALLGSLDEDMTDEDRSFLHISCPRSCILYSTNQIAKIKLITK